ncbi:MAG: glycosyltransferase [Candidatus Yanofskybacteria bacterium]|nr:glycosyltransferase [Candidatus Yanofskybacteria bacterium]
MQNTHVKNMPSLTVIVPAYKKAGILEPFTEIVIGVLNKLGFEDLEILIITNTDKTGVCDATPAVAKALAVRYSNIKDIHNARYVNLGFKYRQGVDLATKEYITCILCDDEINEGVVTSIFSHIGEADVILSYTANMEWRTLFRRILSRIFTRLCNFLFGLKVIYYNGTSIYKRELLRSLDLRNNGLAYNVEAFVSAVKSHPDLTYKEIPVILSRGKPSGFVLKPHNFIEVGKTLLRLFWLVRFQPKRLVKNTQS